MYIYGFPTAPSYYSLSLPCPYAWWPGGLVVCMSCPGPLPSVPYLPMGEGVVWPRWLAGLYVRVCCLSCLVYASSQFKTRREGACVEVKTPCFFSVASPVPSHHLGSAQVDEHVLLHAPLFPKWSRQGARPGVVPVCLAVSSAGRLCLGVCVVTNCGLQKGWWLCARAAHGIWGDAHGVWGEASGGLKGRAQPPTQPPQASGGFYGWSGSRPHPHHIGT